VSRWSRRIGIDADSTVAVAAERQGSNARQLLEAVAVHAGDDEIALSVITVLELAHGVTRADTPDRKDKRQSFLDELLTAVPIHPVTVPVALRAGQIDGRINGRAFGCRYRTSSSGYLLSRSDIRSEPPTFVTLQLIPGLNIIEL
jgi:predicted nucleic acid-binding protein